MTRFSILLVCDTYPPVMGGSEIEAQRVSAELIRRGHRVLVLTSGGPPMPEFSRWTDPEGVPVRILTRRARGRVKDILFALQVARALWTERRDYQIAYFLMQGLHLAAGLPVARALGKPIVMKFGGSGVIPLMRRSRAGRIELRWLRDWARRLMVLNEGMMQEALEYGFPRRQMLWMPNPVDTAEFRPGAPAEVAELRSRFGLSPDAIAILYAGRLAPEKGLMPLLRGFAPVARSHPQALLLLIGDGPMRPELEALAASLGIALRVRFVGRVPSSEVALWLRAGDLFALTSPSEGFPCALLEAMCAALPSVATRIPANTQLIEDSVHGLTVPAGDETAIAAALGMLAGDPALRTRMGAAARRRVIENYSSSKVAERYEALFSELLPQGAGAPARAQAR